MREFKTAVFVDPAKAPSIAELVELYRLDPRAAFDRYVNWHLEHDWLSDFRVRCSTSVLGLDGKVYGGFVNFTREQLLSRRYRYNFNVAAPRLILNLFMLDERYDPKTFKHFSVNELSFVDVVESMPSEWLNEVSH